MHTEEQAGRKEKKEMLQEEEVITKGAQSCASLLFCVCHSKAFRLSIDASIVLFPFEYPKLTWYWRCIEDLATLADAVNMITADNAAAPSKEDLEDLVEDRAEFVQVCDVL